MAVVLKEDHVRVVQRQSKRLLALGVTTLVIAVTGGFVFASTVGRESATSNDAVSIPTSGWRPGDPSGLARTSGVLAATSAHCLYVTDESGNALGSGIVWPAGYTARATGSGVEVLNQAGYVVARTGAPIMLGGGYGRSNDPAGCTGIAGNSRGAAFYVNSELQPIT